MNGMPIPAAWWRGSTLPDPDGEPGDALRAAAARLEAEPGVRDCPACGSRSCRHLVRVVADT